MPPSTTEGSQLSLNKVGDLIRREVAQAGYSECLNFILFSKEEITTKIGRTNDFYAN